MCTDKDHGGKRCINDTSDARRQRRKATHVREQFTTNTLPAAGRIVSPIVNTSPFSEQVQDVRNLINSSLPEGVNQSEHDMVVEQRITELGVSLGQEAEKRAGFDATELASKIAALRDLHIPVRARRKANEAVMYAIEDKMYDYFQKKGLEPVTHVKMVEGRVEDFDDAEGHTLLAEAREAQVLSLML